MLHVFPCRFFFTLYLDLIFHVTFGWLRFDFRGQQSTVDPFQIRILDGKMMENGGIFSQTLIPILIPIGNSPTSALWFATPGCLPQRKSRRRSKSDKISPQDVQYFLKRLWTCVCVIKTLNCLRVFVHSHGKVVLHLSSCVQLPSIVFRSWKPSKMPRSCYYCQSIQLHKDHQCLCWFYYTSFFFRRLYVLHVKILDTYDVLLRVWPESVCRMASRTVEPAPFQALNNAPKKRSPIKRFGEPSREGVAPNPRSHHPSK